MLEIEKLGWNQGEITKKFKTDEIHFKGFIEKTINFLMRIFEFLRD